MLAYLIRRLFLVVPTLFVILLINFTIIQAAPGGPVDKAIAKLQGLDAAGSAQLGGQESREAGPSSKSYSSESRAAKGLPPELVEELRKQYGFDKPAHERFWKMLVDYATFDLGKSFFRDTSVVELIKEKLPVSLSLGLWSTLIIYLVSIPLGIRKAILHGTPFDIWSSGLVIIGNAIPAFLFAILLVILFAGGSYWQLFPLQGLTSENFDQLSLGGKILDYFHHIALPVTAEVIGGFAILTMLTKNSFLDEINKQYVVTARAKGLKESQVLYRHVFRNAMLIVIAGLPAVLMGIFFTEALLIESIFSLDGLGLLSFEAALSRDYPVVFGTLYVFTLMGLLLKIISDLTYTLVDPRIDFEAREH